MYSLCFSVNDEKTSQNCFRTYNDDFCKKAKMGIALGAKIALEDVDDVETYMLMKKIATEAKSMKCQKVDNVEKGEQLKDGDLQYTIYTENFSYLLLKYYGTNESVVFTESDGLVYAQIKGSTTLLTDTDIFENLKEFIKGHQCKE